MVVLPSLNLLKDHRRSPFCSTSTSFVDISLSPGCGALPRNKNKAMGDYTVQISSDLINQLVGNEDKVKKRVKKTKSKTQRQSHEPPSKSDNAGFSNSHGKITSGWTPLPPFHLPGPPSPGIDQDLEAIKSTLKESEKVLERLQKHEDNMVQELTERAKELHDKEFKLPYQKPMPCIAELNACQKCYEENLKNPLKCGSLVKMFVNCSREARMQKAVPSSE